MLSGLRIGVIGTGKIGEILVRGLLHGGVDHARLMGSEPRAEAREALERELDIRMTADNLDLVGQSDLLLLCVKPHQMREVCAEIGPALRPEQILISIAAGVTTAHISKWLGKPNPVLRGMPNTPALVREGITGVCAGAHATEENLALAKAVFAAVGRVAPVPESLMDAVTGLSASGPAYVYLIIEALAEGGVKVGLPRETALELATQTLLGAARMVQETGEHPAKLKDAVTTPAGTTVDGLLELEEGRLRVSLIKAVVKATVRSQDLSQDFARRHHPE